MTLSYLIFTKNYAFKASGIMWDNAKPFIQINLDEMTEIASASTGIASMLKPAALADSRLRMPTHSSQAIAIDIGDLAASTNVSRQWPKPGQAGIG